MKSKVEIILEYNTSLRELINSQVLRTGSDKSSKPVIQQIKDRIKISKDEDWGFLCTAIDTIRDATYAIENFIKYKIDGPTKYDNYGEKILRLYGFLNAVYVLQNAIKSLFSVFGLSKREEVNKIFDDLEIIQLRHKLASHNAIYLSKSGLKDSFYPYDLRPDSHEIKYVANNKNDFNKVNLIEILDIFFEKVLECLDLIYSKCIIRLYRTGREKRKEFEENLEHLRIEKSGGLVIKASKDYTIIFHAPKNKNDG